MTKYILLLAFSLLATACSVSSDTGKQVAIPDVTMTCTSSNCLTSNSMLTVMYITAYACSESTIDFSIAASSSEGVTCNTSTGCSATFTSWVNQTGSSITTIPETTYYLCGIVANSTFSGSWSGHVVAVGKATGQKIDGNQTNLSVNTFINGSVY